MFLLLMKLKKLQIAQDYTVFIERPIYPSAGLSEREQVTAMRNENYAVWKRIYEDFYGIPLSYTCAQD